MRGLQCTVRAVLVVAMLVTATQAAPPTAVDLSVDAQFPGAPNSLDAAQELTPPLLRKRFLGALVRVAASFGKSAIRGGKNVFRGGSKAAAKKAAAKSASKRAAERAAAKKAATAAATKAKDASKTARAIASKAGGATGFAARTGLTKKRIFQELAITVVATVVLNKAFNEYAESKQKKALKEATENAQLAADLASRGELTAEKAQELGVFFDPETGVLELPPGIKIPPPAGAESFSFSVVPPPPIDPALLAEQTKNTTIALDLVAKKELTAEKAAELGLVFDPINQTLEVPEGVDIDSLPEPSAEPATAPATRR